MVPWMSGPSTHQLIEVAGDLFGFHGWSGLADGPVEAAKDVSIAVNPGEFVSIIGPSGCGKSTPLNAVAGFIKPTGGTVTVISRV
jgi:ABC-type nitrate/sulfonate/bicarbonate transport system ATPase subunit